ncbi:MAG TPA: hypothetical protein VNA19_04245 [Pyrinomonadaceae bacterium]|jgi:hypothetical protein|nr:hypothetical protein [Pyrinomonadaceae bacterium]
MTDDKNRNSLNESDAGLRPDTKPDAVEAVNPANDDRAIDIGESGQFAPGGRYNELDANAPRRIDLDEQVDSALSDEQK